ncbi:MAG: hypothetical protein WDN50_12935 [Bradyrhizobium sp.]
MVRRYVLHSWIGLLRKSGSADTGATSCSRGGRHAGGYERDSACSCPTRIATANKSARRLGAHPQIVFKEDRTLIAGLELQGPHFVVSNSWRADLTKILSGLTHDNRA